MTDRQSKENQELIRRYYEGCSQQELLNAMQKNIMALDVVVALMEDREHSQRQVSEETRTENSTSRLGDDAWDWLENGDKLLGQIKQWATMTKRCGCTDRRYRPSKPCAHMEAVMWAQRVMEQVRSWGRGE